MREIKEWSYNVVEHILPSQSEITRAGMHVVRGCSGPSIEATVKDSHQNQHRAIRMSWSRQSRAEHYALRQ